MSTERQISHLTPVQRRQITRMQKDGPVTVDCYKLMRAYSTLLLMGIVFRKASTGEKVFYLSQEWEGIDVTIKPKRFKKFLQDAQSARAKENGVIPDASNNGRSRPPAVYSNASREDHINRILSMSI